MWCIDLSHRARCLVLGDRGTPSGPPISIRNTKELESPFNVPKAQNGDVAPGKYTYSYTCDVLDQQTRAKINGLGVSKSFYFNVARGCDSQLTPTVERAMELTLLTSHAFLRASCDDTRRVKELVFREIDVAPADGAVTMNEIVSAAKRNGVDVPTVKDWFSGADVQFSMGQFLEGTDFVHSHLCKDTASKIQFKSVVYPSSDVGLETSTSECDKGNENMMVQWHVDESIYREEDSTCVYIDGTLAARHQVTKSRDTKVLKTDTRINGEQKERSARTQLYQLSGISDGDPVFSR